MAAYVTDTHALVWYLTNAPDLSSSARAIFQAVATGTNQILVPAIVIAEMVMMAEKRRATLNVAHVVAMLEKTPHYQLVPLTTQIVLRIQTVPTLPDLHDRLIVATALEHSAILITRDATITRSGFVSTAW